MFARAINAIKMLLALIHYICTQEKELIIRAEVIFFQI